MARLGKRLDDGGGGAADSAERESECPVGIGNLDGGDRGAVGFGCEPPTDRTPTEAGGNVECPCFLFYAAFFDDGANDPRNGTPLLVRTISAMPVGERCGDEWAWADQLMR